MRRSEARTRPTAAGWDDLIDMMRRSSRILQRTLVVIDGMELGPGAIPARRLLTRMDVAASVLDDAIRIAIETRPVAGAVAAPAPIGPRVLVVEDDYIVCDELIRFLEDRSVSVIGPAASLEAALHLVRTNRAMDGALLDLNLHGEMVFPVADALAAAQIPFAFVTGYDQSAIPDRFRHVPRCEKPFDMSEIAGTLSPWTRRASIERTVRHRATSDCAS